MATTSEVNAGAAVPAAPAATPIHEQSVDELSVTLGLTEADPADTPDQPDADPDTLELADAPDSEGGDGDDVDAEPDAEHPDLPADDPDAEPPAPGGAKADAPPSVPLAAKFKVRAANGREVSLPKGLVVEYEQDGKAIARPVDHLVRMAQQAARLPQVYEQRDQLRERLLDLETARLPKIKAFIEDILARQDEWLADESLEKFQQAREEYERENTPQAKLARREEKDRREEEARRSAATNTQSVTWFEQQFAPTLAEVYQPFASSVSQEELAGRVLAMSRPYMGPDRRVRPEYFADLMQQVREELPPWLEAIALERSAATVPPRVKKAAAPGKPGAAADRSRVAAQIDKNKSARALRPSIAPARTGGPQRPGSAAPPRPKTAAQANDAIVADLFK